MAMNDADTTLGTVYESAGGIYNVLTDPGERLEATLRGRIKKAAKSGDRVVIGDRVSLTQSGDAWTIEGREERRTELVRRGRGGRAPKTLAANLDTVFTVAGLVAPKASLELIDRLLVLGEASGMKPVLVLNKLDLEGAEPIAEELTALYRPIGYDVLATSAVTGAGLDELRARVCTGSSAFIGPSGVGKSTLLNALDPSLDLQTGALSRKTGTGRHTTVGSRLIPLECGGTVADTPGFGDVGLWGVSADEVGRCFPEFTAPAEACRFRGCTHLHEPECGVRAALEAGDIAESRMTSYAVLRAEAGEAS